MCSKYLYIQINSNIYRKVYSFNFRVSNIIGHSFVDLLKFFSHYILNYSIIGIYSFSKYLLHFEQQIYLDFYLSRTNYICYPLYSTHNTLHRGNKNIDNIDKFIVHKAFNRLKKNKLYWIFFYQLSFRNSHNNLKFHPPKTHAGTILY